MSENSTEDIRPSVTELSYKQTTLRMKDLADEIRRVAGKTEVSAKDDEFLRELKADFDECEAHARKLERSALIERVDLATGSPLISVRGDNPAPKRDRFELESDPFGEPGSVEDARTFTNPWDLSEVRTWNRSPGQVGSEMRARALSAIEKVSGSNDATKKTMTEFIEKWDTPSGKLSKQMLATSSPDYVRAFDKMAKGNKDNMNDRERAAVERAMSLTDTQGGFLVPFQLDPTVIITSAGSTNPIRNIARKVVATGDVWNGVSSAAVSWSWDAEAAEVSDDQTTFAQPSINIYKAAGFVPISIEALQDEQNVAGEIGRLLAFGKDTLESAAFATGSGSAQPFGIVSALSGGSYEVAATTSGSFGIVDLYALDGALPARHRRNASFVAHRAIYNLVRQFDTYGGAALWERLGADAPPLLLGRPAYEASDMDGALGAATVDDWIMVMGDFSNFVVADRIGTTVEFIPHLFSDTTTRPSGQRGWYAHYRVGSDSVNDAAFRLLLV